MLNNNEGNDTCITSLSNTILEFQMQFSIRLIILILSGLSSLLIILTCIITKRKKNFDWNIKLILAQSGAELIATVLALALNYQSGCFPNLCSVFGYIRFSSWLTSLLMSLTMVIILYIGNTNKEQYKLAKLKMNKTILVFYIIPYLWLLAPYCQNFMGPTGWKLHTEPDKNFNIFCGYVIWSDNATYWYSLYFGFPLLSTALISLIYSIKNKAQVQELLEKSIDQGLEFERKLMVFPKIYFFAWLSYLVVRYIDMWHLQIFYTNLPLYITYSFIYLSFDLHICMACYYFFINYEEYLEIKFCWKQILKGRIPQTRQSTMID